MAVSKALMSIQEGQAQAIFDNLQVGDIVQIFDWDTRGTKEEGIIVKKQIFPNNYGIDTLVTTKISYNFRWDGKEALKDIIKQYVVPTELINDFKVRLQWANEFHNSFIDNLTYIELLDRLKEYERTQS